MVRQLGLSAERFACLAVQGGLWVNDSRRLSRGCETKSFGEMNLSSSGWARRSLLALNVAGIVTGSAKFNVDRLNLAVAGLGEGARDAPPGVQILSISCTFWENLAKWYVGPPSPRRVGAPTSGKSWIRHCLS